MKYSTSVEINVPIEALLEILENTDNMAKWQPGFISFTHLSGTAGSPGAVSKLVYKMGEKEVEMLETLIKRDLPHSLVMKYETKGVYNAVDNYFEIIDEETTRWTASNEFKFSGLMALFAFFMKGTFKKQSLKHMELFKNFAEKAYAENQTV